MVTFCPCKHSYQDERYGPLQRVHTVGQKEIRCTACGNGKPLPK